MQKSGESSFVSLEQHCVDIVRNCQWICRIYVLKTNKKFNRLLKTEDVEKYQRLLVKSYPAKMEKDGTLHVDIKDGTKIGVSYDELVKLTGEKRKVFHIFAAYKTTDVLWIKDIIPTNFKHVLAVTKEINTLVLTNK